MAGPRPTSARIRMFQVGFGDCFLLTFEYAQALEDGRAERHVLIDFGTTSLGGGFRSLKPVAESIREHTGGLIDVIVVTHRHRDHLSAFGDKDISEILVAPGYPKLVVRSWTEDPNLDPDAHGTVRRRRRGSHATAQHNARRLAVGRKSIDFMKTLAAANHFTTRFARKVRQPPRNSLAAEAFNLAEDQLKNEDAVRQLERWAAAGNGVYLHYGMRSGIDRVVPGVRTRVLGPPTVDQHEAVTRQREADPDEFWMIYAQLLTNLTRTDLLGRSQGTDGLTSATAGADDAGTPEGIAPAAASATEEAPDASGAFGPVGPVRWLTDRMGRQQLNSLYRIVRILDGVLNNTSIILLFELQGGTETLRLLFGGDAQIENWEYALKQKRNQALLREVDVYKVGHHGSRNATPRTLFDLWQEPETSGRPMWALMSTKPSVHGKSPATAVPRATLVAALDTRMRLHATCDLDDRVPYVELHADLSAGKDIHEVPVAPLPTRKASTQSTQQRSSRSSTGRSNVTIEDVE